MKSLVIAMSLLLTSWFGVDPTVAVAQAADPEAVQRAPTMPFHSGTLTVCWSPTAVRGESRRLLVHFHGAPDTIAAALSRSRLPVVVAIVNFRGLSSAYSKPFASEERLFDEVLDQANQVLRDRGLATATTRWESVSVSSFSAGYGAVRELLKVPAYFDQIDAIVAADSIYAGLEQELPARQVDRTNMRDFLRFARLAAEGQKVFIISHSAQTTPYASTTETADYLLAQLQLARKPDRALRTDQLRQVTSAGRGKFLVLGFEGSEGSDHLQHLRAIDLFWKRLND